jgi:UTP--glucose-1-phosphate uridylyltransferase
MASAIKSALPSHLKPKEEGEANFERRHGKTRSHMVGQNLHLEPPNNPCVLAPTS